MCAMKRIQGMRACLPLLLLAGSAVAGEITTIFAGNSNGGITLDSAGDIYAANYGETDAVTGSEPVWKISPTGAFDPFIFVSDINVASGNDFDSDDNLYQSNFGGDGVSKVDPSGVVTQVPGVIDGPVGIAVDDMGNLFVNGCLENRIVQIAPDGTNSTFVSSAELNCPNGITRTADGDFYIVNWRDGRIFHITESGELTFFASVAPPGAHLTVAGDRLYVTSNGSERIIGFALSGDDAGQVVATIGSGTRGSADGTYFVASFDRPNGITSDASGEILYVTDRNGVRRILLEDEAAPPSPQPQPAPPTQPPSGGGGGGGAFGWSFILALLGSCISARRVRVLARQSSREYPGVRR